MSQNINYLQNEIISKLEKAFSPQEIELIDETHKHKKHKHFQEGKRHFLLIITSAQLKSLPTLKAHQAIYNCLGDLMKDKIHALSIKIL